MSAQIAWKRGCPRCRPLGRPTKRPASRPSSASSRLASPGRSGSATSPRPCGTCSACPPPASRSSRRTANGSSSRPASRLTRRRASTPSARTRSTPPSRRRVRRRGRARGPPVRREPLRRGRSRHPVLRRRPGHAGRDQRRGGALRAGRRAARATPDHATALRDLARHIASLLEDALGQGGTTPEGFAAAVAHEVREPLEALRDDLTLLEAAIGLDLGPEARETLRCAQDRVDRVDELLDGLAELARGTEADGVDSARWTPSSTTSPGRWRTRTRRRPRAGSLPRSAASRSCSARRSPPCSPRPPTPARPGPSSRLTASGPTPAGGSPSRRSRPTRAPSTRAGWRAWLAPSRTPTSRSPAWRWPA
jgi:hypothetical protein